MDGTLRTRQQFELVYRRGRKAVGPLMVAFAFPDPPVVSRDPALEGLAVGIVASRKVGGAVQRNRAKRLLREAFRQLSPQIQRPLWLVLVARQPIRSRDVVAEQVVGELRLLLDRLELRKADR